MCCMRNPLIQYKVVALMHNYLSGSNQFSPEVVRGKLKLFLIKKKAKIWFSMALWALHCLYRPLPSNDCLIVPCSQGASLCSRSCSGAHPISSQRMPPCVLVHLHQDLSWWWIFPLLEGRKNVCSGDFSSLAPPCAPSTVDGACHGDVEALLHVGCKVRPVVFWFFFFPLEQSQCLVLE